MKVPSGVIKDLGLRNNRSVRLGWICFKNGSEQWNDRQVPILPDVTGLDRHWIATERVFERGKWKMLKDAYYRERGRDLESGIPTRTKLEALDLKDIADDLQNNDRA